MPQKISLLGSTGSIGTQTLDIIYRYPDKFKVETITAGSNVNLLIRQAMQFKPANVVISNDSHLDKLKTELKGTGIKIYAGISDMEKVIAGSESDIVLAAIVGYSGLRPVVSAIRAGKKIALANKETLVVAGEIISRLLAQYKTTLIPVDSEHSAIFQCLSGEDHDSIENITLTASGGPFLNMSHTKLKSVSPGDALKHPNWSMGDKITIDSATMMNKGLEVIEARWLFDLVPEKIRVIIHPQSIIHSFVHFRDGSVKAQLGLPDMRVPILYALSYPHRFASDLPRLDLSQSGAFTFQAPDFRKFRSLELAYSALKEGGNKPCILNAANEAAVKAFLSGKIGFLQIPAVVEHALEKNSYLAAPDLEALEASDRTARDTADKYINKLRKK